MTIVKGLATSIKKKSKNEIHLPGNDKLLHWLLLSLVCWLMLERRLCVYNAGLKVDASQEILTVITMHYYENVCLCKRHTVIYRVFCFWRFALLFLCFTTHYCESWYYSRNLMDIVMTLLKIINTLQDFIADAMVVKGVYLRMIPMTKSESLVGTL